MSEIACKKLSENPKRVCRRLLRGKDLLQAARRAGSKATRQDRPLCLWRLRLCLWLLLWSGLMDACLFTASLFVQFSVIAAVRCVAASLLRCCLCCGNSDARVAAGRKINVNNVFGAPRRGTLRLSPGCRTCNLNADSSGRWTETEREGGRETDSCLFFVCTLLLQVCGIKTF